MSTALMTERIAKPSARFNDWDFRARGFKAPSFNAPGSQVKIAGILSLLAVLTAAFAEFYVRGKLNVTGSLIAVSAMIAVTLLFYDILNPLSQRLSLLALSFNLVGLVFELLRLQPRGANIAVVFNGFYCILIGCLVLRPTLASRFLGALMALGGLCWLTLLSSSLASNLSPYSLALGVVGEASACVCLLVMGVNVRPRNAKVSAAGVLWESRTTFSKRNEGQK
jgi:Domain of unknown function (DUF4386)